MFLSLSDNAYTLVAEVMKKLVAIAPTHCHLFITELANAVQTLTKSAMVELQMFGEAVKALLSTASSDCLCLTNPPITTAQRLEPAFVSPMNQ